MSTKAVEALGRATRWRNKGEQLRARGRISQAEECFRKERHWLARYRRVEGLK